VKLCGEIFFFFRLHIGYQFMKVGMRYHINKQKKPLDLFNNTTENIPYKITWLLNVLGKCRKWHGKFIFFKGDRK